MNQQTTDRNCLSFWFPSLQEAGLPVPQTAIVEAECDLTDLLDGQEPEGWESFASRLFKAAKDIGYPLFLRSGHTSGKHGWRRTCYVEKPGDLLAHVGAIVEYSHLVDFFGLPTHVWAVRALIDTEPLFYAFEGMPIIREFRVFARDGNIEHFQSYWPPDAIENPMTRQGNPDPGRFCEVVLAEADEISTHDVNLLSAMARMATSRIGGYWSVDFLQDAADKWWLTDMAEGDRSFRWEP